MAESLRCWWECQDCENWLWRKISSNVKPCPRCGGAVKPSGGFNHPEARQLLKRDAALSELAEIDAPLIGVID